MLAKRFPIFLWMLTLIVITLGIVANSIASIILKDNSYIYGASIGMVFIILWFALKVIFDSKKFFFIFLQTFFFVVPFIIVIIWKDNQTINTISLLTFVWVFNIVAGIYVKLNYIQNSKKNDLQKNNNQKFFASIEKIVIAADLNDQHGFIGKKLLEKILIENYLVNIKVFNCFFKKIPRKTSLIITTKQFSKQLEKTHNHTYVYFVSSFSNLKDYEKLIKLIINARMKEGKVC